MATQTHSLREDRQLSEPRPPRPDRLVIRGFDVAGRPEPEDMLKGEAHAAEEPERELYCFVCGSVITRQGERVAVQGSHEHTFTNPGGYVYRIGCFRTARGCEQAGDFTDAYSWFRGFAWRYALCASCRVHLGWAYRDGEESEFYGLILNRLLESKDFFPSES
jgi:hypothetical protein